LREHVGGVPYDNTKKTFEKLLNPKSLITFGKDSKAKLLICITQYNEPLSQLIESLAGIYRAYYELGE
jgi:mannitol/fructose-specific phosphotransferase system IIA component